ncbi:MAG: multiheme c-type cytochrome [Nannocystales bacterium]
MSKSRPPSRWATGAALSLCVIAAAGATCGGSSTKPGATAEQSSADGTQTPTPQEGRAEFHLFSFARVAGTIAPCGCTTEPLGGLQYAFGYIEAESSETNRLVLEPGSFLFPEKDGPYWPEDEAAWEQARDRAKLLHNRFTALGSALVSGIGPTDVVSPDGVAPLSSFGMPRVAANVVLPAPAKAVSLPPHRIVELTDHGVTWKVGITAVVDPALPGADALGTIADPVASAARVTDAMRQAGAQFTVVLAQGDRAFGESLVRDGTDLVIVAIPHGAERERVGAPASKIGNTYLLEPGTQLQTVTELVVSVDAKAGSVPTVSAWDVVPPKSVLTAEIARVQARITKFKSDPDADAGFIANLEAEKSRLEAQLEGKAEGPAQGVFEQVKVTCKLPVDDVAKTALGDYDKRVAAQNKERFTGVKAPAPKDGEAGYAGIEACSDCHDEAVEFWENTVHASAYETLVVDNKQFDLSCVGCHVTGFRKPGGSEVVENTGLVDVQCEVCHGPGSLHAEDGGDDMSLIKLEAPAELCAGECHTQEHSDTFEYEAYLRDILGPGHGEAKRKLLGDGPTGHDLRQAGLAKAGGKCKKM